MSRMLWSLPALLLALGACSSLERTFDGERDDGFEPVSEQELFAEITGFLTEFTAIVQRTAEQVDQMHDDTETRRRTLLWRIRTIQEMQSILGETDAKRALADLWIFLLQAKVYNTSEDARKDFGGATPVLEKASEELVERVEKIAATVIPPDEMGETKRKLIEYVEKNPMQGGVIGVSPLGESVQTSSKSTLGSIVSAPLAPFRAFDGVSEGAAALNQFAIIGNRFATIIQSMPQQLTWQTQLLLLDLNQSPTVDSLTKSVAQASDASASIADTARSLPAHVGEELRTTLDQVAAQQADLQKTLGDADKLVNDSSALAAALDKTMVSISGTTDAIRQMVETIDTAFLKPEPGAPPPKPSDPPSRPFDITEYTAAAQSLGAAADELRRAVAEVDVLLGDVDKSSSDLEQLAGRLVDRLVWAGVILSAVVLAAFLVHRVVVRRLPAPRA